jgi:hypothetical protein
MNVNVLYSRARKEALTPRNIRVGWSKAGLFPFNPDKVIREIQKPCTELNIPKSKEMVVGSLLPCETLQTPVTAEALGSLNELMQQDAYAQDEASKQRLLMGIQKLSKAAQTSVAECALLKDENRLLFEQNN